MTMMSSSSSAEEDGPPVPTRTKSALTGSLAEKMMKSMGWKEGQGLGKREDGIAKPILPKKREQQVGLGADKKADSTAMINHNQLKECGNSLIGEICFKGNLA